jgi:hypothetical protein
VALIDKYMPVFDVHDRHVKHVVADPLRAYGAVRDLDLNRSWVVRLLFGIRSIPARLFSRRSSRLPSSPQAFLNMVLAQGWKILEEDPGREMVVGCVTQPWKAQVRFKGLAPADFVAFAQPGFAKIAWNIVAEPAAGGAVVSTETRVQTTDQISRRRFRTYWFFLNPGIRLIRRIALQALARDLKAA